MLTRDVPLAGKTISIEQDLSLSHAGTVWDGALVLAYYLHKNPHIVQLCVESRVVLELGSGTGVLGLAAALFRPRAVFLSDLPEFLNILHANRARNDQNWSPAQTRVQVVPLVWGNLESMSPLPHIDTIIGSQLAYDAQNIGYLIDTLIFYAKRNPKTSMLIAYQKYPQPARNLRNRLEQAGCFTMHEVDWEEMDAQYRDESIGILRIAINE